MKVMVDTNVVLDAIADRKPFSENARKIIDLILENQLEGFITANSTADIYYIARKHLNTDDLHTTMNSLFSIFSIVDVLGTDCHRALDSSLQDYEDALLAVCSDKINIDYIITRDEEFLRHATKLFLAVISPADFLEKL